MRYFSLSCFTNCEKNAEFYDIKFWGTNLKQGVQHAVLRKKLYFFLLTVNDFVTKKNC